MNFLAILLAAIASFLFGWLWYGSLSKQWIAAQGKTEADITNEGRPLPMLLVISFVTALVMAYVLATIIAMSADRTIATALWIASMIWIGFIATTMISNHGYQNAKWSLTAIDSGHWLGVLLLQGLILSWMR